MKKLSFVLLALVVWAPGAALAQRVDPELILARQITADQGLFFALARNDIHSLAILRDQGANPNASLSMSGLKVKDVFGGASPLLDQPFDPAGWPILHWAVYLDNLEAVKILLRGGARVNTPDVYGATALHWAAWGGRHSIAKLLLNNGASCWSQDIKRRTPKDWAIMSSQNDLVVLLAARTCRAGSFKDSDGDGVPDHLDLCPNTPLGAPVDERGCWVVAYANFFDFDKAIVKSQYLPHLVNAAEVLKNNPGLKIDLQGHTDAIGSDAYNLGLGLRRAEAVKKVLVANGVSADRLAVSSMGERQPIADNASSRGRALNRRVEIHVRESEAPPLAPGYRPVVSPPPAPVKAARPAPAAAQAPPVALTPAPVAVQAGPPPSAPPLPPSVYPE